MMMDAETRWRYVEPGLNDEPVYVEMSEAQILANYFQWWKSKMEKAGKANLISERNCIDDWVVVNWAEKVEALRGR
jgi:hypothetical protein